MAFVQLSGISLAFGERRILRDVVLNLASGSRTALTGANGSGKTTLMRIIAGEIKPDSGTVIKQRDTRISYLPQSGIVHAGETLLGEVEKAFDAIKADLAEIEAVGERLKTAKEGEEGTQRLLESLHHLQERVEASGYYSRGERIDRVLSGLGFSREDRLRMTDEFSGGWQMRIALAKILLESPDILLLDEPTNYLDIEARSWLEDYLGNFPGGLLLVSHDRYFLDVTVREVVEIFLGQLTRYTGNYTEYEKRREAELAALLDAYKVQQEEIARQEEFIRRFRYNASKAAMVQSRIRQLEKIVPIEIPESMKRIRFSFPEAPHSGRKILTLRGVGKSYGDLRVLSGLDLDVERGEKLVVAGRNGAGKSTLLRILAGRDGAHEGSVEYGAGATIGYFAQDQDGSLNPELTVEGEVESVCPTSLYPKIRNLLGAFLFRGDDVFKSVSVLSGGERNRLALLKMLLHPANLLILDEPTNHLDMNSKDVLLEALLEFAGTVVFVSHDRYFIDRLADKVLELRAGKPHRIFPGDYEYYLYRTAEEEKAGDGAPPAARKENAAEENVAAAKYGREESKRQKSILRKLERREEEILGRIEELETEHRGLQDRLALPEVYADGAKVKEIVAAIQVNERERESLHEQWEEIAEAIEEAGKP